MKVSIEIPDDVCREWIDDLDKSGMPFTFEESVEALFIGLIAEYTEGGPIHKYALERADEIEVRTLARTIACTST